MSSLWRYSVAVLALVTLLAPLSVSGSEVWVDSNVGSAGNKPGCGTSAVPCGTIGYALSTQPTGPIEIVLVEGRTYSDVSDINLQVTGRNATFRTSDGNAATVIDCAGRGSFLKFSNPDMSERTILELNMHTLTVSNCVGSYGGAVSTFGVVNVVLTHCNFLNNRARYGGAVSVGYRVSQRPMAWPTLKLSGVNTFFNNTASGLGGAIYSNHSSIDVSGTHFESNQAGIGGGIYWLSSYYMKVVSSNFKSNRASEQGSDGGSAIFATSASDIILDDVTFDANYARGGGTVCLYFGPSLTLTKSTFTNNRADAGGGGLYLGSSTKASVSSTTFIANGGSRGGAIHVNSATLTASELTAKSNTGAFGGAVYFAANAIGTINDAQFDANRGENGAAIYATNQCQVQLSSCRVLNNFAKREGSGLFCDKSVYTLRGVHFTNNTAGSTRVSSRAQDVYCDTEESYGYCSIEGDSEWNGHCKLVKDNSPKIPVPKWLIAVIISLAVFILLLVLAVAFWMYRVRRVKHGYSKAADGGEGYTMVSGDEQEEQLFGVLTKPNDIHYADDEEEENTDDDDGLIRNRTVN